MSTLLTPSINPREQVIQTKIFFDHGSKKYASTIEEVQKLYGPKAIEKAKAIVNEYATDDTKRLLHSDLGNDPATIHRVLEFADNADKFREHTVEQYEDDGLFYDNSPTMIKGRFQAIETDIHDDFQKMVSGPAKQHYIDRNQELEG